MTSTRRVAVREYRARWFLVFGAVAIHVCDAFAATTVRGTLGKQTEWVARESPYHAVENVEVPVGGVLVIHPGVEVRFERASLIVRGTLVARGTNTDPIVFTSNRDKPAPSDWLFLQFEPGSAPAQFENDEYLAGSILEHSVVEFGHGVYLNQAAPLIRKSTIRDNRKELGGGVFALGGKPIITDCVIEYNSAERSGGGIRTAGCAPTIVGNTIRYNAARSAGGGICVDFSAARIQRNIVSYNSAFRGGGISTGQPRIGESFIATRAHSKPLIQDNLISHNVATSFGGGIDVRGSPKIIENRVFNNRLQATGPPMRNHAKARTDSTDRRKQVGAGIAIEGAYGGTATVASNAIVGNRNASWGGGAFFDRCSAVIEDNYFAGNSATMFGGGISIFARNNAPGFATPLGSGFQINGNLFRDNEGGAVEVTGYGNQRVSLTRCRLEVAGADFAILNHSPNPVAADELSFEGTSPPPVYDYFDDQRLGKVSLQLATEALPLKVAERLAVETGDVVPMRPGELKAAPAIPGVNGLLAADDWVLVRIENL